MIMKAIKIHELLGRYSVFYFSVACQGLYARHNDTLLAHLVPLLENEHFCSKRDMPRNQEARSSYLRPKLRIYGFCTHLSQLDTIQYKKMLIL